MADVKFYPHARHPGRLRRDRGYRKTDATRAPRTPQHLLPDWCLSFELPPIVGFGIPIGPFAGIIGACINPRGHVEIAGKNRGWVCSQAERLVRQIAPYGFVRPVAAILTRGDEPGPTISGPIRKGEQIYCTIDWDGKEARLITGRAMRGLGST
jgi:hypothetical protein